MNLLHLSDLHLESKQQAEALLGRLESDLRKELQVRQLDVIVVSGDISVYAKEDEFAASAWFLQRLMKDFGISSKQLVLVPGNHDVDWSVTKDALTPTKLNKLPASARSYQHPDPGMAYVADEARYAQRFDRFSQFYTCVYGKAYPVDPAEQYEIWCVPEYRTVFLGLNSSWDLNHAVSDTPTIHPLAIARALREVEDSAPDLGWNRIAVWHHPLHSTSDDRIRDHGFAAQLTQSGFTLGLHGHIHDISADAFCYESGPSAKTMHVLAAGTFGAATKELPVATPWEYNFIQLVDNDAHVSARQRRTLNGIWGPFGAWQRGPNEVTSSIRLSLRKRGVEARQMLQTRAELVRHLAGRGINSDGYRIAVEAHIFDDGGRILLQKRGLKARDEVGRFEGVGGDIRRAYDLHEALRAKVKKELGEDVEICIDELLEVRCVPFVERDHDIQEWLVVSYLCRLTAGEPRALNPDLTEELKYFTVEQLVLSSQAELSRSTAAAIHTYYARYRDKPYFHI